MITITRPAFTEARQPEELAGPLFQGEVNAHKIVIENAPAGTVTVRFVRADGQDVALDGWMEDGKACAVLTAGCYAVSGSFRLYIFVIREEETSCIYAFSGRVEQTAGANGGAGVIPPIVESYPDEAIEELRETVGKIPVKRGETDISAMLADEDSVSNGDYTLAIGENVWCTGMDSLCCGDSAEANGDHTISVGLSTQANGPESASFGRGTVAKKRSQMVFGEFNVQDPSSTAWDKRGTYIEIVGNGSASRKANARTLDWSGNETLSGSLTIGKGTADEAQLTPALLKALLALLE